MSFRQSLSGWLYPAEIQLAEQFNYGHREVLISTNGLSSSTLILASVVHGWGQEFNKLGIKKIRSRSLRQYPILTWSERTKLAIEGNGHREVESIGSPWAHLLKSIGIDPVTRFEIRTRPQRENRLLFFPSHSIPGGNVEHRVNLDQIVAAVDVSQVTVCLFWLDFIDPAVRDYYKKFNCEVVCVGYRGSSGFETPWAPIGGRVTFLPQLFELIDSHSIIAVDSISTPFWYALTLNKSVMLTRLQQEVRWWGNMTPSSFLSLDSKNILSTISDHFADFPVGCVVTPTIELLRLALDEIGWDETDKFRILVKNPRYTLNLNFSPELTSPVTRYIEDKISNISSANS